MVELSRLITGCDTGQIQGLSLQVLEKIIVDRPETLSRIEHELIVCEGAQNNPYLQTQAYKALVRAVEDRRIKLHINSCLRTPMQQYMLRRQFEIGICGIQAAAPPPLSNHNSALAIDIQDTVGWRPFLERQSWIWIGAFDEMHYDFKGGGEDLGRLQVRVFQELWNEFNPQERIEVDGDWGSITAAKVLKSPAQGFGKPPVLSKGLFMDEVGKLQALLRKALNLTPDQLAVDMHFGSATLKAVIQFQKANGLEADGKVGPETIAKLEEKTGEKFVVS
ncbi:peptidoglycan-binding protein [Leptolyngbya cf. ectocarpi LEGE 11479]|uniref:Peptidoglycan-binding protein n=1 Tax=Leptolyngbya cf. ectocarpi LEGE 11479 TaxID=1828722 RepID=A0A929A0L3_LEPEC|nr:peptidoglycan-binding protein [Leptolyngbya ectocarpi]MBE9070811.1 peptidoglycan-binding protein [Leptolyngbya cf. ectocarpi LEGE 11479]